MIRFSHQFQIILVRVLLGALLLSFFPACEDRSSEQALKEEVAQLRSQVRVLKQLKYDVATLERDVRDLQDQKRNAKKGNEPIIPTTYTPDGSHKDDPFMGEKQSETLVMMFSDYQCRPCRKFYNETFPKLREQYILPGKVRFVFRDFPLSSNEKAEKAAKLAHCAGEQGKYWEMSALLFEKGETLDQGDWENLWKGVSGVDQGKLKRCFNSKRYLSEVEKDIAEGRRLGAKGAPGFFVGRKRGDSKFDGVFVRGAQPFPVIRAEIEKVLGSTRS